MRSLLYFFSDTPLHRYQGQKLVAEFLPRYPVTPIPRYQLSLNESPRQFPGLASVEDLLRGGDDLRQSFH